MKQDIHPTYYPKAKVTCACGATYTIGATQEKVSVEICRSCHPFYTGTEKILDTAGRVEKFKARVSSKKTVVRKKTEKHATKRAVSSKKPAVKPAPKKGVKKKAA